MTDLTIEYARVCETNFEWETFVEGSSDKLYHITFGIAEKGERDYQCSCPAFTYHPEKPCKHILASQHRRCRWGEDAFAGDFAPANEDGTCPKCNGPTRVIRVAV